MPPRQADVVAQPPRHVGLRRLYGLVGGEDGGEKDLAYAIDPTAVGQPLQSHLSARLQRVH